MELTAATALPVMPVESPEFSANPDPFLEAARREHPWLARFSQGYVVHGYQACADLLADDRNMICGFGPIIDFYGVRGSMWARFMEEIVISQYGPDHARLRGSVAHAFTPRRANQERGMMQRTIKAMLDEWAAARNGARWRSALRSGRDGCCCCRSGNARPRRSACAGFRGR